jgi:large subunit ribosomal protein L18
MKDLAKNKRIKRQSRQKRVRAKVFGTSQRPRLNIFRGLRTISAQLIDDKTGTVIAAAYDKEIKTKKATKTQKATEVGKLISKKALEKDIKEVVFDRAGCKYHGRVKALADAAREGGLEF